MIVIRWLNKNGKKILQYREVYQDGSCSNFVNVEEVNFTEPNCLDCRHNKYKNSIIQKRNICDSCINFSKWVEK